MLYNKRQFRKADDKKVLRKVGKQWKTVSLALLMAIGGIGIASHVSHASVVNNNQTNVDRASTLKERLNSSLQKSPTDSVKTQADVQQANSAAQRQTVPSVAQRVTNQANVLHNRILQNAASRRTQTMDAPRPVTGQSNQKQTVPSIKPIGDPSQNSDVLVNYINETGQKINNLDLQYNRINSSDQTNGQKG